jgi:hypothetical protein
VTGFFVCARSEGETVGYGTIITAISAGAARGPLSRTRALPVPSRLPAIAVAVAAGLRQPREAAGSLRPISPRRSTFPVPISLGLVVVGVAGHQNGKSKSASAKRAFQFGGKSSTVVDHPVTVGYSSIVRTQADFHSALLICVARSQNPMQSASDLPPPPGVLGADPLGLVKEEASGDSAMFGCRVPPEEN